MGSNLQNIPYNRNRIKAASPELPSLFKRKCLSLEFLLLVARRAQPECPGTQLPASVAGHCKQAADAHYNVAGLRQKVALPPDSVAGLQQTVAVLREKVAERRDKVAAFRGKVAAFRGKVAAFREKVAGLPEKVAEFRDQVAGLPETGAALPDAEAIHRSAGRRWRTKDCQHNSNHYSQPIPGGTT